MVKKAKGSKSKRSKVKKTEEVTEQKPVVSEPTKPTIKEAVAKSKKSPIANLLKDKRVTDALEKANMPEDDLQSAYVFNDKVVLVKKNGSKVTVGNC